MPHDARRRLDGRRRRRDRRRVGHAVGAGHARGHRRRRDSSPPRSPPRGAPSWPTRRRSCPRPAPSAADPSDAAQLLARRDDVLRRRAGALLRRSAGHGAGLARAPHRCRRARVPRHAQQRDLGRPRPPARWSMPSPSSGGCSTRTPASTTRRSSSSPSVSPHSLPDPLDTVFLGQQRLRGRRSRAAARAVVVGPRDVLAVREAYHGWTYLTDAVSTSVADNPARPRDAARLGAHRRRARTRSAALTRRGSGEYARDAVAEIERLAAAGTPVGAFLSETVFGNAGGVALPDGYLDAVYRAVRAHGALAIADEVQVGYGGSASGSGASSSRASCPMSSRSRRRWETGIRSAP